MSVSVLGQNIIIINSSQTAMDMLDKKSATYSDRPIMHLAGEMIDWKNCLGLTRYSERFRTHRKMASSLFGSHATMKQFLPALESETHCFIKNLNDSPQELTHHIRQYVNHHTLHIAQVEAASIRMVGASILRISYGYEVKEKDDHFVELANRAMEQFSSATAPGGFLVNVFPPCMFLSTLSRPPIASCSVVRYIPEWFPGGGFHKTAREWAVTLAQMTTEPFEYVKEQMV